MQPHPLANFCWVKLIRFGKILIKFRQNLGKIWAYLIRFGLNGGEIWAKVIRFGQNQNLASQKHPISSGHVFADECYS